LNVAGGQFASDAALGAAGKVRRVLFLTHVGDPGGAELKMLDLARAVRERAEVMLLQHGSLEASLRDQQIPFCVCPMPAAASAVRREGGFMSVLKAIPATLSMIRSVVRKGRQFDAVVCVSQKSFVLAALAKPFMRRPILWFMNDILSPEHFSRAMIRVLMTLSRRGADHIVLNSQASLDEWVRAGGRADRISIIYPGTREDRVGSQLADLGRIAFYREKFSPQRQPLVGVFGRISRWKGQDVFLEAIALVPGIQAVIVGGAHFSEQAHEQRLKELARELGVDRRVTFTGHVDDVMKVMAACDVVVHCSTAPEPFGQVIVQAMLAGVPVIASDAGGAREIVTQDETGQLTPLKDHEALAAAVRRYLADPQWSRGIAHRARTRAEQEFSGAAMARRFLDVLGSI
jgi:glycosyltransferase involved in cell wall biosynthesis